MNRSHRLTRGGIAAAFALGMLGTTLAPVHHAGAAATTVNWITWTAPGSYPFSSSSGSYAKEALGEITMPGGSTVYVKLSGEIISAAGASGFGVTGNSYWATVPYSGSGAAFKSANVPSLPSNGDRIGVDGTGVATQTLSFYSDSARTTPTNVSNIVMPIYSLGSASKFGTWDFAQDFTILSDNRAPNSIYGPLSKLTGSGKYQLKAKEGTGTIQFGGSFNSITWDITAPEFFAAWNIGVTSSSPPLPTITASASTVTGLTGTAITKITFVPGAFAGAVTYSVKTGTLPAGLSLNSATGEITGTPSATVSALDVVIEGTDGSSTATTTITFTFTPPSTTTTPPTTTLAPSTTVARATTTTLAGGPTLTTVNDSALSGGGMEESGPRDLASGGVDMSFLLFAGLTLVVTGLASRRIRDAQ